jgi:segregation and condensation protein B
MAEASSSPPPPSVPDGPTPADVVEALLFASDGPLEPERIREVLGLADVGEARALAADLQARYEGTSRALSIAEAAGGYRMVTRREMAPWLVRLARVKTKARLSRASLEALAIVGYKQPVSRPELDAIRGVNSEGVLDSLLERGLIRIAGRKEAPGRPFLYETTREFLVAFGLRDLGDLPTVDGELVVPTPAAEAGTAVEDAGVGDGAGAVDDAAVTEDAIVGEPGVVETSGVDDPAGMAEIRCDDGADGEAAVAEPSAIDDAAVAETATLEDVTPTQAPGAEHDEAPAQQDPGAGGAGVAPER